ncbi:hypothetical protein ACP70R_019759 [Stipagrostis hirtigluma subsp. patula]
MPQEGRMDPRLVRFLLHLATARIARRPETPEARLLRLILRLPLRLVGLVLAPLDAAPPRRLDPEDETFLLPPASPATTSSAPATLTDMLLAAAARTVLQRLVPATAALEGRAPAAPLLLLLLAVRDAVVRGAAPPSAAAMEGHVVEPLPLHEAHPHLRVEPQHHADRPKRGVVAPPARTATTPTLLEVVLAVAVHRRVRLLPPRAAALGGGVVGAADIHHPPPPRGASPGSPRSSSPGGAPGAAPAALTYARPPPAAPGSVACPPASSLFDLPILAHLMLRRKASSQWREHMAATAPARLFPAAADEPLRSAGCT